MVAIIETGEKYRDNVMADCPVMSEVQDFILEVMGSFSGKQGLGR